MASPMHPRERRCGDHAVDLIAARVQRLVALQADVLADCDPEPLHQMRVSCRQLRSTLEQFGPALELPDQLSPQRVAKFGQRLGLCRDLDVLRKRLDHQLLPFVPELEQELLQRFRRQLKRERKHAFADLKEVLHGRSYLKWLARCQAWLRLPSFSVIGLQPLGDWFPELAHSVVLNLTLLPGWQVLDPTTEASAEALHLLRRRIKRARYGFNNLLVCEPQLQPWCERFKAMQASLGDLNDLQLLDCALAEHFEDRAAEQLPQLRVLIAEQRQIAWSSWQALAAELARPDQRSALYQLLSGAPAVSAAACAGERIQG